MVHTHKEKWKDVICRKMVQLEMVTFSKLNQRKTNTECSLICGSYVTDTKTHVCICDVKGGRGKREGRKGRAKYIIYSHGSTVKCGVVRTGHLQTPAVPTR